MHSDDLGEEIEGEYRHKHSHLDGLTVERDGAAFTFIFRQFGEETQRCTKTEASARLALQDYEPV